MSYKSHSISCPVGKSAPGLSITLLFLALIFPIFSGTVFSSDDLQINVIPSKSAYVSGDSVIVALQVIIPHGYHLYGNPLGPGIGKPVEIRVDGAKRINWTGVKKPGARKFIPPMGDWVWAYENSTYFFIQGKIPEGLKGKTEGKIHFDGLICDNACIPVSKDIPFSFNTGENVTSGNHFASNSELVVQLKKASQFMELARPEVQTDAAAPLSVSFGDIKAPGQNQAVSQISQWDYSPVEKKIQFNLWLAILFGFIAGIILNAMPCVLPVLGIKILSFSQARENSRKNAILRSAAFAAGIISVFMVLASLASFAKFSWGEQFQNPRVLVAIIALIVIFALGMFDVFMIILPGSVSNMEKKSGSGFVGDFFKGMFATVLATPCSGPLLGATLAWTLTQLPQVVFAVFASIGLGMAFPYILFASSSRLSRLIPKPGEWMKDFKYLMGFVLIGMAVYLMMGLPQDMIISTIGLCVFLAFAVMVYTRFAPWGSSLIRKTSVLVVALLIATSGVYVNFGILYNNILHQSAAKMNQSGEWKTFSPELLKRAHADGRHVIVDFSANWCMNCKYNEAVILNSPQVKELIKNKNGSCTES